jgi:hypothetical protein
MIISDCISLIVSTRSSLSAAGEFAYMVRLRKGEKSFKTNLAHSPAGGGCSLIVEAR